MPNSSDPSIFNYLFFLGSHWELSAAELWGVLDHEGYFVSSPALPNIHNEILDLKLSQELRPDFLRQLGGTDRISRVIHRQDSPISIEELIAVLSPLPEKCTVGISVTDKSWKEAQRIGMGLKKAARAEGKSFSFVTAEHGTRRKGKKAGFLNAAHVLFHHLLEKDNFEVVVGKFGEEYIVARTEQMQDIQGYELRDTGRPRRDARVGMLPPKLAQVLINLAVSQIAQHRAVATPLPTGSRLIRDDILLYDPFCGLGTVVQEGWMMGYNVMGSDLKGDMIEATRQNLEWVHEHFSSAPGVNPSTDIRLFTHDVKDAFPEDISGTVDAVVTEPFLGTPLTTPLTGIEADDYLADLAKLYVRFFATIRTALKPGAVVAFVLPALRQAQFKDREEQMRTEGGNFHLVRLMPDSVLDEIIELGYNQLQPLPEPLKRFCTTTHRDTFTYARPDALVARELIIMQYGT